VIGAGRSLLEVDAAIPRAEPGGMDFDQDLRRVPNSCTRHAIMDKWVCAPIGFLTMLGGFTGARVLAQSATRAWILVEVWLT